MVKGGELRGDVGVTDYRGNIALDEATRGRSRGLRYRADQAWCEISDVGVE